MIISTIIIYNKEELFKKIFPKKLSHDIVMILNDDGSSLITNEWLNIYIVIIFLGISILALIGIILYKRRVLAIKEALRMEEEEILKGEAFDKVYKDYIDHTHRKIVQGKDNEDVLLKIIKEMNSITSRRPIIHSDWPPHLQLGRYYTCELICRLKKGFPNKYGIKVTEVDIHGHVGFIIYVKREGKNPKHQRCVGPSLSVIQDLESSPWISPAIRSR